jgi:hypothetical protein
MDRITKSLMEDYFRDQGIEVSDEASAFEDFCNYCIVSHELPYHAAEEFDVDDISVGQLPFDLGIDGIAVFLNERLVDSKEEVKELIGVSGYLDLTCVFVQAKTSSKFDSGDLLKFFNGVDCFFNKKSSLPRNEFVEHKADLVSYILDDNSVYLKTKPVCKLYYVTTGQWNDDTSLKILCEDQKEKLLDNSKNLFRNVIFTPCGADEINKLYRSTKTTVSAEIDFEDRVSLPEIKGVTEAFIGVLPFKEFINLIKDEYGRIRSSIFYDNVRYYKGPEIEVNQDIANTLKTGKIEQFVVLNNGITIVAKSISGIRKKLILNDYQIVNGCQTSHVIFENQNVDGIENLYIPIKIVVAAQEEIVTNIIKATNRQTEVTKEELLALSDFQKKLELYYSQMDTDDPLYYERQAGQFRQGVIKRRVVSITHQIKTFAAMFLDQPHLASRYYGNIYKEVVNGNIFSEKHEAISYYASARAYYVLDNQFNRANVIDPKYKICRFHILMALRYLVAGIERPQFTSKRKIEPYCERILNVLADPNKCLNSINEAISCIDKAAKNSIDRDKFKTQSFTDDLIKELKSRQS